MFVLEHYRPVGFFGDRHVWEQVAVSNDELALEEFRMRKLDQENWRVREVDSLAQKGYVEDLEDPDDD